MNEHWKEHGPPVYVSAAIYLGLTGKKTDTGKATKITEVDAEENAKNLAALAAQLEGSGGVFHG